MAHTNPRFMLAFSTRIDSIEPERVRVTVRSCARIRVRGNALGYVRCGSERRWVWGRFDETFRIEVSRERETARFVVSRAQDTARFVVSLARGTARFVVSLARGTARFDQRGEVRVTAQGLGGRVQRLVPVTASTDLAPPRAARTELRVRSFTPRAPRLRALLNNDLFQPEDSTP